MSFFFSSFCSTSPSSYLYESIHTHDSAHKCSYIAAQCKMNLWNGFGWHRSVRMSAQFSLQIRNEWAKLLWILHDMQTDRKKNELCSMSIGENAYLRHLHDHYIKSLERMTKVVLMGKKVSIFFCVKIVWKNRKKSSCFLEVWCRFEIDLKCWKFRKVNRCRNHANFTKCMMFWIGFD